MNEKDASTNDGVGEEHSEATPGAEVKEPRSISLFGLRFTEIATLISLVLSLIANVVVFYHFLHGPLIKGITPSHVMIECSNPVFDEQVDQYVCHDDSILLIRAPMVYLNEGGRTQSSVLRMEKVKIEFGGKTAALRWWYFTDRTNFDDSMTAVSPQLIKGDSVVAHETQFWPLDRQDRLIWKDFIDQLESDGKMTLTFEAELYGKARGHLKKLLFGDHDLLLECTVSFNQSAVDSLVNKRVWTTTRSCS